MEPTWKNHSTLRIDIRYARGVKPHHDPDVPLLAESLTLQGKHLDHLQMGIVPDRLWMFPVVADFLTAELAIPEESTGVSQLAEMSNEGLEVLRNSLLGLHREATRILNERGSARYGSALGPGPAFDGLLEP